MAQVQLFFTATGSITVPSDFDPTNNTVECIGCGAGDPTLARGGGGGAYAKRSNAPLTPGSTAFVNVPTAGSGTNRGPTWLNFTTNAAPASAAAGVLARGANGATGGLSATSIGDVVFAGGNAGAISNNEPGGGGAAGANGAGGNGGSGGAGGPSGGGGADGGATGGVPGGGAGANGGGNGGSGNSSGPGVDGGDGTEYDATHGSGGGGGGGPSSGGFGGGAGGKFGGGAGGTNSGNSLGAGGLIVITYTPTAVTATPFSRGYIIG